MKKIIFILLILSLFSSQAVAQKLSMPQDSVKVSLPSLAEMYYSDYSYLTHDYRYELFNKKRSLERKSKSMYMLGFLTMLGTDLLGGAIAIDKGWSSWIYIPCATVVSCGLLTPFIILGSKYKKEAQAIDVTASYMFELDNGRIQIGPSLIRTKHALCNQSQNSFGLSIKTIF